MKNVFLFVTFIFAVFISLWNLDFLTIRVFDEARNAINALEMYQTNNWLYSTYEYKPDMWNTKPPLLIWLQTILMHLVGANEWAIRLPSALAGIGIALTFIKFSIKELKSISIAVFAILGLFSCKGYIEMHALRTGDFDSLLTFFDVLLVFTVYKYSIKKSNRYLYFSSVIISLLILTKGIAGVLFLPGLAIYLFLTKNLNRMLANKSFYFAAVIPVLITIIYYFGRELITPGYLKAIWDNELFGRFAKINESNQGDKLFYWDILKSPSFGKRILLLAFLSLPLSLVRKKKVSFSLLCNVTVFVFLVIISISKTKLPWYILPAYPILSIMSAIALFHIFGLIKNLNLIKSSFAYIIMAILAISVYGRTVYSNSKPILFPEDPDISDGELGRHLRNGVYEKTYYNSKYVFLYLEHIQQHYRFYINQIPSSNTKILNINYVFNKLPKKVAAGLQSIQNQIEINYKYKSIQNVGKVKYYEILEAKNTIAQRLENYDLTKLYFDKNGIGSLKNKNNKNEIMVVSNANDISNFVLEVNTMFKQNKRIEITEIPYWDGLKFRDYSIRFIVCDGDAYGIKYRCIKNKSEVKGVIEY